MSRLMNSVIGSRNIRHNRGHLHMQCCLSNQVPLEPVVSRVSGHLFEKRLIVKYLLEHQKCPITGGPLHFDDLITVHFGDRSGPRTALTGSTGIPGLLQTLHNEWDAIILEQFILRQELCRSQKELDNKMCELEASTQIIAQLMKENEFLKDQLKNQGNLANATSTTSQSPEILEEREDINFSYLDHYQTVLDRCEEIAKENRRLRKDSLEGYPSNEIISSFTQCDRRSAVLHGLPGGCTGLSVAAVHSSEGQTYVLSGGADGVIRKWSLTRELKDIAVGTGHRGTICCVGAIDSDSYLSCGDDGTVRVWRQEQETGILIDSISISAHLGPAIQMQSISNSNLVISRGIDGAVILTDVGEGKIVSKKSFTEKNTHDNGAGLSIHPFGGLFGIGSHKNVLLWDTRRMSVDSLLPLNFMPTALAFHPDCYSLAVGSENGAINIFDLRRPESPVRQESSLLTYPVRMLTFDTHGIYLAAVGKTVSIREWQSLKDLTSADIQNITTAYSIAWRPDAHGIIVGGIDQFVTAFEQ